MLLGSARFQTRVAHQLVLLEINQINMTSIEEIMPGSNVEKSVELMGQIPKLMEELSQNHQQEQIFKEILEKIQKEGIKDQKISNKISDYLEICSKSKKDLKQRILEIITRLEELGHGFVVQGARESLKNLE